MTPEQLASMPAHEAHWKKRATADMERMTEQVRSLQITVRAMRVHRMASEYPVGHFERDKRLPEMVKEWEDQFGPAPASTQPPCSENATDVSQEATGSPR